MTRSEESTRLMHLIKRRVMSQFTRVIPPNELTSYESVTRVTILKLGKKHEYQLFQRVKCCQ